MSVVGYRVKLLKLTELIQRSNTMKTLFAFVFIASSVTFPSAQAQEPVPVTSFTVSGSAGILS